MKWMSLLYLVMQSVFAARGQNIVKSIKNGSLQSSGNLPEITAIPSHWLHAVVGFIAARDRVTAALQHSTRFCRPQQ
jgi:hypothetical protein